MFQTVVRVMDDYEVAEEELYNHIGIFLENNANLLKGGAGADKDSENDEDDSRNDQNFSNQRAAPKNNRRQQNPVRIRDQAQIASGGLAAKKLKKANNVTGVNLAGEPIKKIKKG